MYLYLIDNLGDGGQEKQLFLLLKGLKNVGKKCAVFVFHYNKNDKYLLRLNELKIPVYFYHGRSKIAKINALRKIVIQQKARILQSFSFHSNFLASLCCIGTKTKAIGALRSLPIYNIKTSGLMRSSLSFIFPFNIISNNYTGAKQINFLKLFGKKIYVVSNGIEESEITKEKSSSNTIKTISIGRISEEKRLDILIEVILKLKNKGVKITHEHWGNGDLRNYYTNSVRSKKLENEFTFRGTTHNINEQLFQSDFLIHTSDIEGMPNVIMEAMQNKLAVVTTKCGDANFIIDDKENGILCEKGNVDEIINACLWLIENPRERMEMGRKARIKIIENYSVEKYIKNTLSVYESIFKKD